MAHLPSSIDGDHQKQLYFLRDRPIEYDQLDVDLRIPKYEKDPNYIL